MLHSPKKGKSMATLIHKKLNGRRITAKIIPLAKIDQEYVFYIHTSQFPKKIEGVRFALLYASPKKEGYTTIEFFDRNYNVIRRYFNIAENITVSPEKVEYLDLERDVVESKGSIKCLDNYPEGERKKKVKEIEKRIIKDIKSGEVERKSKKVVKRLSAILKCICPEKL